MSPDGMWVESRNEFARYSDIQIGLSAKGKSHMRETNLHAVARELFEEIDMDLSRKELEQVEYMSVWGKITSFKLDITKLNKVPINPF